MLGCVEHEKSFITLGPDLSSFENTVDLISWLLVKPSDQDQHYFPLYL